MLYRKFYYDNDDCHLQLIVPRTHQQVVFKHFHDIPSITLFIYSLSHCLHIVFSAEVPLDTWYHIDLSCLFSKDVSIIHKSGSSNWSCLIVLGSHLYPLWIIGWVWLLVHTLTISCLFSSISLLLHHSTLALLFIIIIVTLFVGEMLIVYYYLKRTRDI
jgi:hypothetical protein